MDNAAEFLHEISTAIDHGCQEVINNHVEDIRKAVVTEALSLFSKTKFKAVPDLDKKVALFNARITREYGQAQITYLDGALSLKVHDVTLEKSLSYGTSWFDPIDDLNASLAKTVLGYVNRSIY